MRATCGTLPSSSYSSRQVPLKGEEIEDIKNPVRLPDPGPPRKLKNCAAIGHVPNSIILVAARTVTHSLDKNVESLAPVQYVPQRITDGSEGLGMASMDSAGIVADVTTTFGVQR